MERGRLLIIIGIALALATLWAVASLVISTIPPSINESDSPHLRFQAYDVSSEKFDCVVITDLSGKIVGLDCDRVTR